MIAILLALLAIGPEPPAVTESVGAIEVNHFYDDNAKHVFSQLIFRDLRNGHLEIVDWKMIRVHEQLPINRRCLWMEGNLIRDVRTKVVIESHSQTDPELVERSVFPKEMRRELSRVVRRSRAAEVMKEFNEAHNGR